MELHKALRNIIQTEGCEIIKDLRIINILDDFNAYKDIPASKYILRAIITEGYAKKLLKLGKWGSEAETLIAKFTNMTGFVPEYVSLLFQSIAYSLGLIEEINYQNNNKSQNLSTNVEENYIMKIVDINRDGEDEHGVKLKNISYEIDSVKKFYLIIEIQKIKKMQMLV